VDEQDAANGEFGFVFAFFTQSLLQTCQRCAGSTDAAIACHRIFLKRESASKTAWETSTVVRIEKVTVVISVDAENGSIFIRECPTDVIVTTHIVDPCRARVELEAFCQCLREQAYLTRGQ
jgi:hypothetical protein